MQIYLKLVLLITLALSAGAYAEQQISKTPTCTLCKIIVQEMFKYLNNNRTEQSIENGLLKICRYAFPTNEANRNQCSEMVRAYTKELVQLMADESDPEVVCMMIDQCTYQVANDGRQEKNINYNNENLKTTIESDVDPVDSVSIGQFITMLDSDIELNSMRTCVECKLFIRYLQDTLHDAKSKESLKKWLLENLCQNLNEQQAKDSCVKMVNQYSDAFFEAVAERLEPQDVCEELKACQKKKFWSLKFLSESQNYLKQNSISGLLDGFIRDFQAREEEEDSVCDQCIEVIKEIDDYLSAQSFDKDVTELINQVCNKIPDQKLRDNCAEVVKTLGQEIVEAIHTMDNPRQLCSKVRLC